MCVDGGNCWSRSVVGADVRGITSSIVGLFLSCNWCRGGESYADAKRSHNHRFTHPILSLQVRKFTRFICHLNQINHTTKVLLWKLKDCTNVRTLSDLLNWKHWDKYFFLYKLKVMRQGVMANEVAVTLLACVSSQTHLSDNNQIICN